MVKIGEKMKTMIRDWLNVVPATNQTIVLNEKMTREIEILRSQIWYRGDSFELHQFFHQTSASNGGFWASAPATNKVRKIHSALPAIIADTLAYIVKSDLDNVELEQQEAWDEIAKTIDLTELVGDAVLDVLVDGDGAFKISVDESLSPYPIVEFVGGDRVDFEYERGIISAVIFKTTYKLDNGKLYQLQERYSKGSVTSILYDKNGNQIKNLDIIPQLVGITELIEFDGDYMMAVPLRFYKDKKHKNRGKSIFEGGKSDCFDALDEVISQWLDAIRAGRVSKYIPLDLIPRKQEDGDLKQVNSFGTEFIMLKNSLGLGDDGGSSKIEVVQPDIKYEAYVTSYTNTLLMCLQGLVSPATLGIDVGKMSSADAQREKKDVTGNTRNTITGTLEKALPNLISAILKTYDNMQNRELQEYEATVSFGEYGAPDFDSRVETVGKASSYGVMSVETQIEELWGSSKEEKWKAIEINRIKTERGFVEGEPAKVGDELVDI